MSKTLSFIGAAACAASLLGCGPDIEKSSSRPQASAPAEAPPTVNETAGAAAPVDGPKAAESAAAEAATAPATEQAAGTDAKPVAAPAANAGEPMAAAPDAMGDREVAKDGVGKKGRGYGGGIVTEPVHQYFSIQQRLVFEDQIPHAMNMYKALHDNKGPSTHAKFMKEIIAENNIPLPELPQGEKYVYDPKTETLMVEHPSR
jgi:hypothetical protein